MRPCLLSLRTRISAAHLRPRTGDDSVTTNMCFAHALSDSDAPCGSLLYVQAIAIYQAKSQHTARDSLSRQLAKDHGITSKSVRGEA